ncbi:HNH endonuclease [Acetobacter oeni]|uniref:HNH domain-containing protein n=1 Tax=Acetobacter oeni TaxID=304077 RepID=A0A511XQP8_9PROT|nr:HNH endonuclease [Acetobacter oeni]MBB3882076.1 uncharacterized protein (TIGR02646 family) [Acetobacter oeni]NHO17608.1 hypothetical protein [Acetobacter oeni]GBR06868.1 hypothetical protein AA21952_2144 [Acetobacter oeni LMG 21952]GEN65239.1 hypothetical protein AOE01nite_34630 [Acetobacter oeni]
MIPLEKSAKPQILVDYEAEWTQLLLDKAAANTEPTQTEKTRYRHPDIKAALVAETNNKCAYCESKLQHIHHGDVEHIMPKSLELSKTVVWTNLTLACEVCNQNKSNLDPNANQIIDPYNTDPELHIVFLGAFAVPRGTVAGESTKAILDLDRPALIEQRGDRLKYLMSIYSKVLRTDIPLAARRAIYHDLVRREAANDKAFSAMARDAIAAMAHVVPSAVKKGI